MLTDFNTNGTIMNGLHIEQFDFNIFEKFDCANDSLSLERSV